MPTRRRTVIRPIDSSTRTASRTTVRDTPNCSAASSATIRLPGGNAPDTMSQPQRWTTESCNCLGSAFPSSM